MDKYQLLKQIKFFNHFTTENLKKYLSETDIRIREYKEEELVLAQGQKLEEAVFVLEGILKGQKLKENGSVIEVERFRPGTLIAPAFLFAEKNFIPVDLISVKGSMIIGIHREKFFNLIMSSHEVMREFLKISSEKTFVITEKMVENTGNIAEKLDRYIERYRRGDEIKFSVSLKELAENFSVERPSLSRVISGYIKEGKLEKIGKNHYKIKNLSDR